MTDTYTEELTQLERVMYEVNHNSTPRGGCEHCRLPLVPIGAARANGKSHQDWPTRQYHKKCWVERKRLGLETEPKTTELTYQRPPPGFEYRVPRKWGPTGSERDWDAPMVLRPIWK